MSVCRRYSAAIKGVRKEDTERSPDEPEQSAEVQIVVSPAQFQWLTKQCEFLGVTKQEMIADADILEGMDLPKRGSHDASPRPLCDGPVGA